MRKKTIAVIDSGIGGLHILKECCKVLPNYNYVYVADTFNAPYGDKSKRKLNKIAYDLVEKIDKKYKPEIIVFACNSLTVNTIKSIRKKFKNKFVGTEPAIKQAKINGGDILIFATKSTLKNYNNLNKKIDRQLKTEYRKQNLKYINFDKVYKVYIDNLPTEIDNNIENLDSLTEKLKTVFDNEIYKHCPNVVIGCTHYIAIKKQLKNILGADKQFFDGVKAIAKQVLLLSESKRTKNKKFDMEKNLKFLVTDGDLIKKQNLINYFKKIYMEDISPDNS